MVKKTLVIFCFFTLLWFTNQAFSQDKVIDQIIAVVGNNYVLKSDIESQFIQIKSENNSNIVDLKCNILEELLYQNLLLHQAELDSLTVSDKEVDAQLDRRIRYFVSQVGSEKKLEEYFNKSIFEIKNNLRESLKKQMVSEKMQDKLTGNIKVTPSEVRQFFKTLPPDSIPVINEEIEYEQIVLYPAITEQEKLSVKEKLNELRNRVLKGDNFGTLAVLYSEDPGSATKGGDLGFVGRSDLVPEFAAVAFKLKDGEVSKIVETDYGYHIIQLIERRGEQINIRHILITPKVDPVSAVKSRNRLDSLTTSIHLDSITFIKAAEKYSQDNETRYNGGLAVNPYNNNNRFDLDQLDAITSYQIKKIKIGEISSPFEFTDEKGKKCYKIIRLKARYPLHKANLTDDYQKIQEISIAKKKQNIMKRWVEKEQQITYIHIDNSYKNCNFLYSDWIK
ncbi:MAG: peptidylprolyl isomerase [Bacteroidetes bacterium CG23_combo_of_CG06-09_8_20_14_all_32_9]|nr:MAG: peptidylprolyl isomerase [Bacteroidetes bacterium CG23_combo_of_CG06-09_8_20_14_all_32_9]